MVVFSSTKSSNDHSAYKQPLVTTMPYSKILHRFYNWLCGARSYDSKQPGQANGEESALVALGKHYKVSSLVREWSIGSLKVSYITDTVH